MGIPENHFLRGYPDGGMDGSKSIYMCTLQKNSKSQHLRYICAWNKLLKSMENIILRERPNAIFSVDLDSHPDHQMCSFAFDIVMGKILSRSYNDYFPYIFKGFAYSTAYGSFKRFL